MKKPVNVYQIHYSKRAKLDYYGDCEWNNYSCDMCNFAANNSGSEKGSQNSGNAGRYWK